MDPHILNVQRKLTQRSARGLEKYGVDMTRTDLSTVQWLIHLQEEVMDASVYLERLIADAKAKEVDHGKEETEVG